MRIAMGITYNGQAYQGWQSQLSGITVQDHLEAALSRFAASPISTNCAGRTDAGVHGLMQVVHFDSPVARTEASWVRGTNTFLPKDIAVQWVRTVPDDFHSRACATSRRYGYALLQSPVRPSVEAGRVGWVYQPLDLEPMQRAVQYLLGEHDFSSFRAAGCQAKSPVKTLYAIHIARSTQRPSASRDGMPSCYWRFDFQGSAFLHHMIRNIMGCLVVIGQGAQPPEWMLEVLNARSRKVAAPTFSPDGLYFLGPQYDPRWGLPTEAISFDWFA